MGQYKVQITTGKRGFNEYIFKMYVIATNDHS